MAEVVRDFDFESVEVDSSEPGPSLDAVPQQRDPDGGSSEGPASVDASEAAGGEERALFAEAGKPRRFSLFRER